MLGEVVGAAGVPDAVVRAHTKTAMCEHDVTPLAAHGSVPIRGVHTADPATTRPAGALFTTRGGAGRV
ncbi:hypothetical protein GCM10018954_047710 [Kutzneria kofuensis]